jgi:catechol 2,3-dioxygenase-like lactoylglutathione lyase family enzyme
MATVRRLRADDGQTAPYCLLLRPESPCRLGQLDLAIETASNRITKLNCTELQNDGVGNAVNESIMLHSVVAFHCNQQLEPVRAYRYNLTLNLPQTGLLLHRRSPHLPRFKRVNVSHSVQFYKKIFGFQVISDFGERGCAMRAGSRQVLLLFKKGGSRNMVSPHDGDGELHLAFGIAADELTSWEAWLAENGIAVEETRTWEFGGHSLYFRDPDRHLLEIATPGVWSIY